MKETKNSTWKQKLSSINSLRSDIRYIFSDAKKEKRSHSFLVDILAKRIYSTQKYITLPNYIRSEINGYIYANFDIMYNYVDWCHWYDGKFVGKKLTYNKGFNQELVVSHYVYKNTEIIYS